MSEPKICTCEELENLLKKTVSEKRFIHSIGVADTVGEILKHYNLKAEPETWNGFEASVFCGLAHDFAREKSNEEILSYCMDNGIKLGTDEAEFPVLAHGKVSADEVEKLCGHYPENWKRAICIHTTGDSDMDSLALALFCADYIEPSRVFMTEERRNGYLSQPTLEECSYAVVCDMIKHWQEKEKCFSYDRTLAMKEFLKRSLHK